MYFEMSGSPSFLEFSGEVSGVGRAGVVDSACFALGRAVEAVFVRTFAFTAGVVLFAVVLQDAGRLGVLSRSRGLVLLPLTSSLLLLPLGSEGGGAMTATRKASASAMGDVKRCLERGICLGVFPMLPGTLLLLRDAGC